MILLCALAWARPTDGSGTYAYDASDVVESTVAPDGLVRVWYSVEGPNAVLAGDADVDGVPDFAALAGATTEAALELYVATGFRAPLDDSEGGPELDLYLLDFAGKADGHYSAEECTGNLCSGYMVMENDFKGYGYSDVVSAIRVLTSHELFHAVQAAYDVEMEVWLSEGTAVWAEILFDPESQDFIWFADAYLEDTGRSLNEPPSGPVPTFAYATGLWWWFMADKYGSDSIVALLEACEAGGDLLERMAETLQAQGGDLAGDWTLFTRYNLATGRRAGAMESYPFAERIGPVKDEAKGESLDDDNRFYPLAATYYVLDHAGGPVVLTLEDDASNLVFSLHPLDDDGAALPAVAEVSGLAGAQELGDLEAGTYWLVGTNPTLAQNSTKVRFCLGSPEASAACAPVEDSDPAPDVHPEEEGCGGCGGGGGASVAAFGIALALQRRKGRPLAA